MGLWKSDHIKRLITLTGDYIKRLLLYLKLSHEKIFSFSMRSVCGFEFETPALIVNGISALILVISSTDNETSVYLKKYFCPISIFEYCNAIVRKSTWNHYVLFVAFKWILLSPVIDFVVFGKWTIWFFYS